ncbi:hypothetical protein V2U79_05270 [Streptococcus agalactiae]|nr:hypothetical protein [Streptococcus agalactiae]
MHITYLQSSEMSIAIRDVMARVGHANYETTMIYTHKQSDSQQNILEKFMILSKTNVTMQIQKYFR